MVERAGCSNGNGTSLNGVPSRSRDGKLFEKEANLAHAPNEEGSLARGNSRFSIFRWFKRAAAGSSLEQRRNTSKIRGCRKLNPRRRSFASSTESVGTFYSTTTVRSFAYHTPNTLPRCEDSSLDILTQAAEVGPFAAGASKLPIGRKVCAIESGNTLPANALSRRRDITARYSLQPNITFNSCANFSLTDRNDRPAKKLQQGGETAGEHSIGRRVHVKGKRRAPNPPGLVKAIDAGDTPKNSSRRKRPAPKPPEGIRETVSPENSKKTVVTKGGGMDLGKHTVQEVHAISNDTLVLQGGVLLSKKEVAQSLGCTTEKLSSPIIQEDQSQIDCHQSVTGTLNTVMPRPWYKRSVFDCRDTGSSKKNDVLRSPASSSVEVKDECCGTASSATSTFSTDTSLSRLSFFHRNERQIDDRKKDIKRKSGLSILANISELDKEAAAIVQEEQARARASMLFDSSRFADALDRRNDVKEELVHDIVTSAMDTSFPKRGTRALISKFNAISNITKVTVNSNFFARNSRDHSKVDRDIIRNSRFDNDANGRVRSSFSASEENAPFERDLSKYFAPRPNRPKNRVDAQTKNQDLRAIKKNEFDSSLAVDTADRISYLQKQLIANRIADAAASNKNASAMRERRLVEESAEKKEKKSKRIENELLERYLFPPTQIASGNRESKLDNDKESTSSNKRMLDRDQTEFSDFLEEMDQQFKECFSKSKIHHQRKENVKEKSDKIKPIENKVSTSKKVEKVIDILVEAEKDNRNKVPYKLDNLIYIDEVPDSNYGARPKQENVKSSPVLVIKDTATVDLKEMLKEMKHSLPKRPKPKKSVIEDNGPVERFISIPKSTPGDFASYSNKPVALKTTVVVLQNDYDLEKQKVSSSAQTSGNVRKLIPTTSDKPSTAELKQDDIKVETISINKESQKHTLRPGFTKNTFHLIRPRDFAQIEATRATKESANESIYTNIIDESLYANTNVSPSTSKRSELAKPVDKLDLTNTVPNTSDFASTEIDKNHVSSGDEDTEKTLREKNMNTLAVNQLLKKLEIAIASGNHQKAAGLAKELARLKIPCFVVRQRSTRLKEKLIKVNMYIEDKLAHQGPIPLQVPVRMTVAELKAKVQQEFEIPTNVQRWIIGKNLADQDNSTLEDLQIIEDSSIFLYLVAPDVQQEVALEKTVFIEEINDASNVEIKEESAAVVEEFEDAKQDEIPKENKLEEYEELMSLENCDVIPNSEPIDCPICFVTYGPQEGVILRDCLHMFCRACLANTIIYCEDAEVKCPYRDADYACESTLQEREIKALVEPAVYQQHLAKSISQAENNAGNNAFHCKTPDCPGWCIYDDDVNNFLCPVCNINNCLTCQAIHTGKNCRQYQEELRFSKETDHESRRTAEMLEDMVNRGEALPCPTCAVVLMKKWGCDWLRCSMCKTEICWVTKGPRWGPKGNGDTSGGCRCGENGIKCHPRCNYCH